MSHSIAHCGVKRHSPAFSAVVAVVMSNVEVVLVDEQRFTVSGLERRQGLLMLGVGLILLGTGVLMANHFWPTKPIGALLGILAGLSSGGLTVVLALRGLWPRTLIVSTHYGELHQIGRPTLEWEWSDGSRLDWRAASTSRFAPEEPILVLADGEEISLEPFGIDAYQAIRERFLLGSLSHADSE